ncbi:MAG TPA: ABC transporter permease [Acidimicrobiales bacterium]|nr:ABC transporter permease [Acidimicrobiales bacterium]
MSDIAERRPHLIIRPKARWSLFHLGELWEFRDLLVTFAGRDVRLRYRQTALGVIWVVVQPLLAAGILSFVFGSVADLPSEGVPYFVFAYAGTLAWTAFSSTLTKASGSLVGNAALVSKVFFPRMLLPLSVVGSTLLDFAVALVVMAVLVVVGGVTPGVAIVLVPVWLLLVLLLALGVGFLASSLMVRYRDVQYVLPVAIQFALFASPVAYAVDAVPESARPFFDLNPLVGVLEAFRWSLLDVDAPSAGALAYSAIAAVVLFVVGAAWFTRVERQFADVI